MKTYTLQERIDMILVIGECEENCFLASRVYAQKYPDRNHPNKDVLTRLLEVFRETGSVSYKKVCRQKPITGNEENEFLVIGSAVEDPQTSQRKISHETGISRQSIQRILKRNRFHPYKIQMHQTLFNQDYARRLDFCFWVLNMVEQDKDFFDFVLFSDESTFHNNGLVNRHNFHYYSDVNPHYFRTLDRQNRWSVNVWGGVLGTRLIGPFFFEGHLNGRMFFHFLSRDLPELLEDVPLIIRQRMWLQLDGAPAHFQVNVRDLLDTLFPNKWLGRGGPKNWPARSPDLTSPDFFLWGYIKNIVYATPPTTPQNMKDRITAAFQSVTPQMLLNVKHSFNRRVRLCVDQGGSHFEHLL